MWAPGTASGYHPITIGYLAGELFRLVDGRTMGAALREEFGAAVPVLSHGPLGLAASASRSLGEALALIARFLALRAPLLSLQVAPATGGLWARFDHTPFGHGQPYTVSQLSRLLRQEMAHFKL